MKYNISINCGENRPSLAEFLDLEKEASEETSVVQPSVNETLDEEMEEKEEEEKKEITEETNTVSVDVIPETQMPVTNGSHNYIIMLIYAYD